MKELTEKQLTVLNFIRAYSKENVCPPTVREVATFLNVSLKAAQDHIAALRKKQYIAPSEKRSRSLRILVDIDNGEAKSPAVLEVPLLGSVAAGKPLFCEENFEKTIPIPQDLVRTGHSYFALQVRGTSMINAGILDGDTAIIEQSEIAENGQIVVALLDDSVTLKRFVREASRIKLQAENPDFKPIYCQDVRILGKLAGIIRSY